MQRIIYPILISILLVSLCFVFFEELEQYFTDLLELARSQPNKYAFLSFLVLSSDIILPVPSSVVMYYNGLVLGFLKGLGLSLISLMVSASVGYFIGYSATFAKKQKENLQAEAIIKNYGSLGIILTRGIPILSESICFTAGYNRMNFKAFSVLNFVGCLPICIVYAYFGNMGKDTNLFYYSFGLSIVVSLLMFQLGKRLIKKYDS